MEQAAVGTDAHAGGLLTVMEAAYELRIGYAATLAAIRRGDLPARKVGKSYRLQRSAIDALASAIGRLYETAQLEERLQKLEEGTHAHSR